MVKKVNIKMLDVLYDNQVCKLVYMTDLTSIIKENERSQAEQNLLKVSNWICDELETP